MRLFYVNNKESTKEYFDARLKFKITNYICDNFDDILDAKWGMLNIEYKSYGAGKVLKTLDAAFYFELRRSETDYALKDAYKELELNWQIEVNDTTFTIKEVEE